MWKAGTEIRFEHQHCERVHSRYGIKHWGRIYSLVAAVLETTIGAVAVVYRAWGILRILFVKE